MRGAKAVVLIVKSTMMTSCRMSLHPAGKSSTPVGLPLSIDSKGTNLKNAESRCKDHVDLMDLSVPTTGMF